MSFFNIRDRQTDVSVVIDAASFEKLREEMLVLIAATDRACSQLATLTKALDQANTDSKRTIKDLKALQSHRPGIRNH